MAAQTERGIPLSALSPKFLHTNSTSHTWPFSAIAELIDNAYDPDVSAKQFWIDKTRIKGYDCLTFMDNGAGMNYNKMHKMLSFGFSEKQTVNGHIPVGLYGNGFKSGSMRLGKDAIVFSKTQESMTVGMLSQTYLDSVDACHVVVPIVTFTLISQSQYGAEPEHSASLQDILTHSIFKTESELFSELQAINGISSTGLTGTRIIIWNLRRMSNGQCEFDFNVNRYDVQIPADVFENSSERYKRQERSMESVPESDYSLRAYCSILYLKPRMQIIIRGQKVKTQLISKSLAFIAKDHYKPNFLNKRIKITFGYNTKSKEQYGIMMYHKNRLIKAYERVGCQLKANNRGVGVIGVIECNFLKPTHNKQDFDYTDEYRKTIHNLGVKLEEYWNEIRFKRDREDPNCTVPVEDTMKRPDQNWVQCDSCLKWRKLPDGIDCSLLPEKWFCYLNPDPQFRSCQVDEEPEDSDDDQPSYQKTYKQQERYIKMQQEKSRLQLEQAKKAADMQRLTVLAQQNEALKRQHEDLKRQLEQSALPSSSPSVCRNVRGENMNDMPIISSVCSLSPAARMKRTLRVESDGAESKRMRMQKSKQVSDTCTSVNSHLTPVLIASDDDDDDLVIVETSSTPRPKAPAFDLSKVKQECPSMHRERSDDAAVEKATQPITTVTESSPSPQQQQQVSATTQTEPKVKDEDDSEESNGDKVCGGEEHSLEDAEKPGRGQRSDEEQDVTQTNTVQEKVAVDAQLQQDQLVDLMQETAQERDGYMQQVHELTCETADLHKQLLELSHSVVKKERCEQHTQTDACAPHSVMRQLERSQVEKEELQIKLAKVESEKDTLRSECQQLRKEVEELKRSAEAQHNRNTGNAGNASPGPQRVNGSYQPVEQTEDRTRTPVCDPTHNLGNGETTNRIPESDNHTHAEDKTRVQSEEEKRKLRKLRHSVSRLLVTFVPALELEQVNYDCDVIDEILEQVVDEVMEAGET